MAVQVVLVVLAVLVVLVVLAVVEIDKKLVVDLDILKNNAIVICQEAKTFCNFQKEIVKDVQKDLG